MRNKVVPLLMVAACLRLPAAVTGARIAHPPASGISEGIGYPFGGGSVRVDYKNAGLIANADIWSKVEAETGPLSLSATGMPLSRYSRCKEVMPAAPLTAQVAENGRTLPVDVQEQERIAAERAAAAARPNAEAETRAAAKTGETGSPAEAYAQQPADLPSERQAQIRAEAAGRETQMRAEAEIAEDRAPVKGEAAQAEIDRLQRAAVELRARLFDQFNKILETRDSPRGLIVTMSDVLFKTGKNGLRMDAREKLARFTGIVLAHPGLLIRVEGHADGTGGDERKIKLSWQRAEAVRNHLVLQTLAESSIAAFGYSKELPVTENTSTAGGQKNRRVELVVSGEVIGVKIESK